MLYGVTTLCASPRRRVYFQEKLSFCRGRKAHVVFAPFVVGLPSRRRARFFIFFRFRRGKKGVRIALLSSAPQKCHPCRSSCMSQFKKRTGNHEKSYIFGLRAVAGLRAVFCDPYRTFSPSEAVVLLSFSFFVFFFFENR